MIESLLLFVRLNPTITSKLLSRFEMGNAADQLTVERDADPGDVRGPRNVEFNQRLLRVCLAKMVPADDGQNRTRNVRVAHDLPKLNLVHSKISGCLAEGQAQSRNR